MAELDKLIVCRGMSRHNFVESIKTGSGLSPIPTRFSLLPPLETPDRPSRSASRSPPLCFRSKSTDFAFTSGIAAPDVTLRGFGTIGDLVGLVPASARLLSAFRWQRLPQHGLSGAARCPHCGSRRAGVIQTATRADESPSRSMSAVAKIRVLLQSARRPC